MKYFLFFLFVMSLPVFGQEKPETVDALLKKQNPNQYRALKNKDHYLNIVNLRSGKTRKFFEDDIISFKTTQGKYFSDQITEIKDSSFVITRYDQVDRHLELLEFWPNEISLVYKHPKRKIGFGLPLILESILGITLIFDKAAYNVNLSENKSSWIMAPYIFAGGFLLQNKGKLFNKINVKTNHSLKIQKAF